MNMLAGLNLLETLQLTTFFVANFLFTRFFVAKFLFLHFFLVQKVFARKVYGISSFVRHTAADSRVLGP